MTQNQQPRIRFATREDIPEILGMIKELADFEKAIDKVLATEETLATTLILAPSASNPHPKPGYAYTLLLTMNSTSSSGASSKEEIAGMAMYFNNYSTWISSPGIYLEDLYIKPAYRRCGFATMLLKRLADETSKISNGKGRLEWSCLRWNENALKFYEWLGGQRLDEWVQIRVEGQGLASMADLRGSGGS